MDHFIPSVLGGRVLVLTRSPLRALTQFFLQAVLWWGVVNKIMLRPITLVPIFFLRLFHTPLARVIDPSRWVCYVTVSLKLSHVLLHLCYVLIFMFFLSVHFANSYHAASHHNDTSSNEFHDSEKVGHDATADAPYLAGNMNEDYEGKPTNEELKTLRRVPANIPVVAYLICIVEFAERASYYGVQPLISNFVNRPMPTGGNGA